MMAKSEGQRHLTALCTNGENRTATAATARTGAPTAPRVGIHGARIHH
jgi:hypothetical protein